MNTNNDILSDVNRILNDIRARKERVNQLKCGLNAINGGTQDSSKFHFGKELTVELSFYDRRYMHQIHKHYQTAMVFIKRGINEEIEMHEKIIKDREVELSEIDLVKLSNQR